MKKVINISVEREDKDESYVYAQVTAACTVWDESGNGWVKFTMDDETYWIHSRELKKLLRVMKKMK